MLLSITLLLLSSLFLPWLALFCLRFVVQPLEFDVARREQAQVVPLLEVGIVVASPQVQHSRQLGVLGVAPHTLQGLKVGDPILQKKWHHPWQPQHREKTSSGATSSTPPPRSLTTAHPWTTSWRWWMPAAPLSSAMYYYSTAAGSYPIPHNNDRRTRAVAIVWKAEEGRDDANGGREWQWRWWSRRLMSDASAGEERWRESIC
jgi:hypothetical protein